MCKFFLRPAGKLPSSIQIYKKTRARLHISKKNCTFAAGLYTFNKNPL